MTLWPHQAPCLIIGHRGAMGYAPENTMASFDEAIRRGADLLELDVQLTHDGELAVIHDTSVDRTTNGQGLVRDLAWKKMKTLDAGAWHGPEFAHQYIPSLGEVISRFRHRKTARRHSIGLIIELKTIRGSGGSLADAVVALLQKEQFIERVVVISFDSVALQEVHSANKHIPIGLLFNEEKEKEVSPITLARDIGAHAILPRKTAVNAKLVGAAHKAGLAVATWTPNTKNEMKRMLTCGVDAIITNFPGPAAVLDELIMLKAIIFDMDGVICDSEPLHMQAFQRVLTEEGISLTDNDYYDEYLAYDDRGCFTKIFEAQKKALDPEKLKKLVARKGHYFDEMMKDGLVIYPGAENFVKKAADKFLVALASGARRLEVEFVLKKAKVRGLFTAVVSADDVKKGKPDPESFLTALKTMNERRLQGSPEITPADCLVIEDSLHGIAAARSAGMKAAAVTTSFKAEQLTQANMIIESLVGLDLDKLEKLFV